MSVTITGRAAYGVGVQTSVSASANGLSPSASYSTGLGAHTQATLDVLVFNGGPINGYHLNGSACIGGELGGCVSGNFDPRTQNVQVYFSAGAVAGASVGVRPAYSAHIGR